MLHLSFSFQASRCMHRDHRSRSRSASAVNRFLRVRAERRGGRSYKRRFKSACLSLLTYFIELLQTLQNSPGFDIYDPRNRHLIQRADQAWAARQRIRDNQWTPTRFEVLLPRLDTAEDEVDSIVAESLAVTSVSGSEVEEVSASGPVNRPSSATSAPSAPSTLASVRVSRSNPLLNQRVAVPTRILQVSKIEVLPQVEWKYDRKTIVSLDWHQVLDTLRFADYTERPSGYDLTTSVRDLLQTVKQSIPNCIVLVNSYCCAEGYRQGVLSIQPRFPHLVDHCITTSERCGQCGKLSALGHLCSPSCKIIHSAKSFFVERQYIHNWISLQSKCRVIGGDKGTCKSLGERTWSKQFLHTST